MGEAKKRALSNKALLEGEMRCIYCAALPTTIEHMPPRLLFFQKRRPRGLEFGACRECNNFTKSADATAAFFSRMSPSNFDNFWETTEGERLKFTVARDAPQVYHDLIYRSNEQSIWQRERSSLLMRKSKFEVTSPVIKAHLDVFCAKLGMALYREHVGTPLPEKGGVETTWFLNAGLSQDVAEAMLHILPLGATLKQGDFAVPDQFSYRYNCDRKSIFAALISLHHNLHISIMASSDPEKFNLPADIPHMRTTTKFLRPGDLIGYLRSVTTRSLRPSNKSG